MPLKKGKSQKTVSANVRTLVDDYSKSGRIGTSKPANKKAAVKQAVAIALRQAGKPKKFAEGGSVNNPLIMEENYDGRSSASRTTSSEKPETTSASKQQQQQRQALSYLTLQNQAGQVEDQFPKYKQTRMRMRFTPEAVDVSRAMPVPAGERKEMRRGGKVSSKKGPKK